MILTYENQFLYSTKEHVETDIKNLIPFAVAPKKKEILKYEPNKTFIGLVY